MLVIVFTMPLEIITWSIPGNTLCKKNCMTYSCILGAPNTLGNFLFAEKHRLGESLPNIFRILGVPEYFR